MRIDQRIGSEQSRTTLSATIICHFWFWLFLVCSKARADKQGKPKSNVYIATGVVQKERTNSHRNNDCLDQQNGEKKTGSKIRFVSETQTRMPNLPFFFHRLHCFKYILYYVLFI